MDKAKGATGENAEGAGSSEALRDALEVEQQAPSPSPAEPIVENVSSDDYLGPMIWIPASVALVAEGKVRKEWPSSSPHGEFGLPMALSLGMYLWRLCNILLLRCSHNCRLT